jgi:mono/diheme cytochrome c family protein
MKRPVRVTILAVGMVTMLFSPMVGLLQPAEVFSQDPLAGSRVFGIKGCSGCHAVNGVGGKFLRSSERHVESHP